MIRKFTIGILTTFLGFNLNASIEQSLANPESPAQTVTVADLPRPETIYTELESILINAGDRAPEMIENLLRQDIATEQLKMARSAYWPRLSTGLSFGANRTYREGGKTTNSFGLNGGVNLSRPLYHWGAVHAGIKIGELTYDRSVRITEEAFQGLVQKFRSNYMDLVINNIELRNTRLNESILKDDAKTKKSEFEAGRISAEEYLEFQISLEESFLDIEKIIYENREIADDFEHASGVKIELEGAREIPPLNLNLIQRWISDFRLPGNWYSTTRQILNQMDAVQQEKERYTVIRANQRPNVNFSASISRDFTDTINGAAVPTTNVFGGLGVGWNIFDGFQTSARKRESLHKREIASNDLANLEYALVQEESIARRDLKISLDGLKLSEKLFSLQLKQHNRQVEDQESGLISANQLKAYRLNFFNKEMAVAKKRSALLMALMEYIAKVEIDPAINYLDIEVVE